MALAGLGVVLSACEAGDEKATTGPTSTEPPSATVVGTPSQTPQLATPVPLGNVASVDEEGFYVLEVSRGDVWRVDPSYAASGLWSPDGRALARFGPERRDADLVNFSNGSVQRIFSGGFWGASWSPDGRRIAFSTKDGLFTVRTDGSDIRLLDAVDGRAGIGWSPRGDLIASSERYQVRVTDVATGESRTVSPEVDSDDYLGFMQWLPNGDRLLMCSSPASDAKRTWLGPGTYIYDLTDASTRKLVETCGVLLSPDGKSFAYNDGNRIFVAATDGSQPPRLLAEGYELGIWSPDGASLSLGRKACETGDFDIYSVRLDGGAVSRLTDSPEAFKESAGWSPVVNDLAYSAKLGDTSYALVLVGFNPGASRRLLTSSRHIHGPQWSPDGRYLAFSVGGGHGVC